MVVIFWPSAAETGVTHERIAAPFMCTAHAPHSAWPQPNLVPVMPSVSRSAQRMGVLLSTSTSTSLPFTFSLAMVPPRESESRKCRLYACAAHETRNGPDRVGPFCASMGLLMLHALGAEDGSRRGEEGREAQCDLRAARIVRAREREDRGERGRAGRLTRE